MGDDRRLAPCTLRGIQRVTSGREREQRPPFVLRARPLVGARTSIWQASCVSQLTRFSGLWSVGYTGFLVARG